MDVVGLWDLCNRDTLGFVLQLLYNRCKALWDSFQCPNITISSDTADILHYGSVGLWNCGTVTL